MKYIGTFQTVTYHQVEVEADNAEDAGVALKEAVKTDSNLVQVSQETNLVQFIPEDQIEEMANTDVDALDAEYEEVNDANEAP